MKFSNASSELLVCTQSPYLIRLNSRGSILEIGDFSSDDSCAEFMLSSFSGDFWGDISPNLWVEPDASLFALLESEREGNRWLLDEDLESDDFQGFSLDDDLELELPVFSEVGDPDAQ